MSGFDKKIANMTFRVVFCVYPEAIFCAEKTGTPGKIAGATGISGAVSGRAGMLGNGAKLEVQGRRRSAVLNSL